MKSVKDQTPVPTGNAHSEKNQRQIFLRSLAERGTTAIIFSHPRMPFTSLFFHRVGLPTICYHIVYMSYELRSPNFEEKALEVDFFGWLTLACCS